MSDNIPDHLIANVLLRLPFDSLIRFRCVSKSWCALIDSPDFNKMHSKRSHLIKPYSHPESKIIALKGSKCYVFDSVKTGSARAIAKELNYPLEFPEHELEIAGSSNGLLCLRHFEKDKTILWNPWIQKYSELPSRPYKYNNSCRGVLGTAFGYDHVNDDYNVVKWNTFVDFSDLNNLPKGPRICRFKLFVYSLKLNSWSRIEKVIPFELPESQRLFSYEHAVANGALHWYVSDKPRYGERFIVAFDLGSKEFRKISCAPSSINPKYLYTQLCTLNGCLASFCFYLSRERHAAGLADLWVMEDYGVESSWTKLTSIDIPHLRVVDRILVRGMEIGNFRPVAFSSKRKQLLLQIAWQKLVLYDLENKSMRDVTISGEASCYWSCVCAGSLVRPCSYT